MKTRHIYLYLKNLEDGDKIIFEHMLEQWRESIGLPIEKDPMNSSFYSEKSMTPTQSPSTSRQSSPYPNPSSQGEEYEKQFVNISMILNNTARRQFLVNHYNSCQKFGEEQRKMLINTIVSYFEENHAVFTFRDSRRIEKEIVERFPTENLEYYRTSSRGRIYNKFSNNKKSFRLSGSPCFLEPEGNNPVLDSESNA
ncbi:uncharacterized protein LOC129940518 [Eupeodes corollae]|uniref:uncharacterized protein LOC129940518 n=1 Tax=Eupeodes corollae TaxID=290404 RepID=UPI00248FC6E4|nr:uncharacterized protein LOC129940518 [Eupeodes corollae]